MPTPPDRPPLLGNHQWAGPISLLKPLLSATPPALDSLRHFSRDSLRQPRGFDPKSLRDLKAEETQSASLYSTRINSLSAAGIELPRVDKCGLRPVFSSLGPTIHHRPFRIPKTL